MPRVAYFPDSFHEVNGVAHTSRNFVAYAKRHALPFLCVRAGRQIPAFEQVGELRTLDLKRSRGSVRMEKDLEFDTLFWRHEQEIRLALEILILTGRWRNLPTRISLPRGSSRVCCKRWSHWVKNFISVKGPDCSSIRKTVVTFPRRKILPHVRGFPATPCT